MIWYLETKRVRLRELTLDDQQNIFDLDSDPEVMKYLTGGKPSSQQEALAGCERSVATLRKHNGKFGLWAAIEKSSGEFMGWFHFRPDRKDPNNVERIELGYRMKRKFWGMGIATEVSFALIEKGFNELNVKEVFAKTMAANIASQTVMKKVGMTFVREFLDPEHAGTRENDVEYSLKKPEGRYGKS